VGEKKLGETTGVKRRGIGGPSASWTETTAFRHILQNRPRRVSGEQGRGKGFKTNSWERKGKKKQRDRGNAAQTRGAFKEKREFSPGGGELFFEYSRGKEVPTGLRTSTWEKKDRKSSGSMNLSPLSLGTLYLSAGRLFGRSGRERGVLNTFDYVTFKKPLGEEKKDSR